MSRRLAAAATAVLAAAGLLAIPAAGAWPGAAGTATPAATAIPAVSGSTAAAGQPVSPAVAPAGVLTTVGGSAGAGRGPDVAEEPVDVAAGPGGSLLVADDATDAVRLLTPTGNAGIVAGDGLANYNGDARTAVTASLDAPGGVVLDRHGDVVVSDTADDRVRLVAAADCSGGCPYGLASTVAGEIYTIAGDGTAGSAGDVGRATAAQLRGPQGLALDPAGDLLIADTYNQRVQLVAAASCAASCAFGLPSLVAGDIYTLAGTGTYGYSGTANGGPAAGAALAAPQGLATDAAGDLVIADAGENHVRIVAWQGCTSSCRFGLASITAGDIYAVAGRMGSGQTGASLGDGGPATVAQLDAPAGVAVDRTGDILVADTLDNRVRLVAASTCSSSCPYGLASTTAGYIYTIAGDGTAGFAGDGGPAAAAELRAPASVAVDAAGNVLVADTGNGRVRMVAAAPCSARCPYGSAGIAAGDVTTIAGDGAVHLSGNGGPAASAELLAPGGLSLDGAGDVAVADSGNDEVRLVAAGACDRGCPAGLGSTVAGDLYDVAGDGIAGFYGDGGRATAAELDDPTGTATGAAGALVVADTGNDRIRIVASASCAGNCPYGFASMRAGDIYTLAGDGTAGYSGDGGRAAAAALDAPTAVAPGELGEILVADTGNDRIRMVAAVTCRTRCPLGIATAAGDIYTIAGDGVLGYAGDGGPARTAELAQPQGVAPGPAGTVLVSDSLDNRIRLVASAHCTQACPYGLPSTSAGDIYTVAGDGSFGYSGDGGPARSAALADPTGIAADAAGNVYVADAGNERVRVVSDERCLAACRFGVAATAPGSIATIAGTGNLAVSANGKPASSLSLAAPLSVAVDAAGGVEILESAAGSVRRVCSSPTDGFVLATSAGNVYAYGAPFDGSLAGVPLPAPIVGIAADPVAGGYWLVGTDGSVYAFGGAQYDGSMRGHHLNKPIVAIAPTDDGRGYWLVASDGGIFAFGDARFVGSMGGRHLNEPIVGMAAAPAGLGYWLVASDGGIFTFGNAKYRGSMGGTRLTRPVFAMASTPDGYGYWMVASDGGTFAFGDAHFHGSLGGFHLHSSIVGMAADPVSGGYRLADADGRVYPFAAPGYGGTDTRVPRPLVAIATDH